MTREKKNTPHLLPLGIVPVLPILPRPPQEHDLPHIVQQTGELEPLRVAGGADALGGLEEVEEVGEVEVGVGSVDVAIY